MHHIPSNYQLPPQPDTSLYQSPAHGSVSASRDIVKTKMCKYFGRGYCRRGFNCKLYVKFCDITNSAWCLNNAVAGYMTLSSIKYRTHADPHIILIAAHTASNMSLGSVGYQRPVNTCTLSMFSHVRVLKPSISFGVPYPDKHRIQWDSLQIYALPSRARMHERHLPVGS